MTTPLIQFCPQGMRDALHPSLAILVRRIGQARQLKRHYVRSLAPLLLSLGLDLYVDDLEDVPRLLGPASVPLTLADERGAAMEGRRKADRPSTLKDTLLSAARCDDSHIECWITPESSDLQAALARGKQFLHLLATVPQDAPLLWRQDCAASELCNLACVLIAFPSTPPARTARVCCSSWNLSSFTDLDSQTGRNKLGLIRGQLKKGIVCLQETNWTKPQSTAVRTALSQSKVLSSPRPTELGPGSGGVAILVPPAWHVQESEEIVPGFVLRARLANQGHLLDVYSYYVHADRFHDILAQWTSRLPNDAASVQTMVLGDANLAATECPLPWQALLDTAHWVSPHPPLVTYRSGSAESPLDI